MGHPESPARYDAIEQILTSDRSPSGLIRLNPRPASLSDIERCHESRYVQWVREDVQDAIRCLRTGDTDICERSFEVALLAAGGVMSAIDAVMAGRVRNAFCAVRPPGHHATRDRGMGFCIFNNVAIGARYVQHRYGIERILIVDWDIHHGNGTQEIFYEDPTVFYFSTHRWPYYPGTGGVTECGTGKGYGFTLNCPLACGSGRTEVLGAFRQQLVPAMDRFRPEFVLISAGFDSRLGDPLGGFTLSDDDFADLTRSVMDLAARYAGGRLVSVLEGGYDLEGLAAAVLAHVRTLCEGGGGQGASSQGS